MKCPGCDGKGFIEKHYGLVMAKCSECKGTGEIDMENYMQGQVYGEQGEAIPVAFPRDMEGDPSVLKDGPLRIYPGDTISGELKFAKGFDYDAVDSGDRPPDKSVRSAAARKPTRTRKRPKSRKA